MDPGAEWEFAARGGLVGAKRVMLAKRMPPTWIPPDLVRTVTSASGSPGSAAAGRS